MTVVLALVGMLLIPTTIFRSLAGGAILVAIAAVAASLTLPPGFSTRCFPGPGTRSPSRRRHDRVRGRRRDWVVPGAAAVAGDLLKLRHREV
jgi:uncharacterized membrane protein YdfJ with MMPL/SSD domain